MKENSHLRRTSGEALVPISLIGIFSLASGLALGRRLMEQKETRGRRPLGKFCGGCRQPKPRWARTPSACPGPSLWPVGLGPSTPSPACHPLALRSPRSLGSLNSFIHPPHAARRRGAHQVGLFWGPYTPATTAATAANQAPLGLACLRTVTKLPLAGVVRHVACFLWPRPS